MEKIFIEKSLKRFLKGKRKITTGLVIGFLMIGINIFSQDRLINFKQNIKTEEFSKNILKKSINDLSELDDFFSSDNLGDGEGKNYTYNDTDKTLKIYESPDKKGNYLTVVYNKNSKNLTFTSSNADNKTFTVSFDENKINETAYNNLITSLKNAVNGDISFKQNSIGKSGVNNGIITAAYAQYIYNNGEGINNGVINSSSSGQYIVNGTAINNGIINSNYAGQYIKDKGIAVNNGIINVDGSYGQIIFSNATGIVINTGNIESTLAGQWGAEGIMINTETIDSKTGQYINKGIVINDGTINSTNTGQDVYSNGVAINSGTINSSYAGQNISGNGIIFNSGTIDVDGTSSYGQLINNGTAINTGKIESEYVGQWIVTDGVIINDGTINGKTGQNIAKNGIAINSGTINGSSKGQNIGSNGIMFNSGTINSNEGQYIENNGIGINDGVINNNLYSGQDIYKDGIGIILNNGIINGLGKNSYGQEIAGSGIGINTGTINSNYIGQSIDEDGNGIIINLDAINIGADIETKNKTTSGQYVNNGVAVNSGIIDIEADKSKVDLLHVHGQYAENNSIAINSGIINSNGKRGQYIEGNSTTKTTMKGLVLNNGIINTSSYGQDISKAVGINNGIIIAQEAYHTAMVTSTPYMFYKNGIALKRVGENLLINEKDKPNENIEILDKTKLGDKQNNFSNVVKNLTKKDVGEDSNRNKIKGYNLFINNLGNNGENTNKNNFGDNKEDINKNNSLILDKNLSGEYANTHITTAVTVDGKTDEAVIKTDENLDLSSSKNFMDKSTIVGYFEADGTLLDMTEVSGEINLQDSVVSAFAGSESTGYSRDGDFEVTTVKFGEGSTVSLNNSTIMGTAEFTGGKNILNLGAQYHGTDSSAYTDGTLFDTTVENINFKEGNDKINISLGENENEKGFVNLIGEINFEGGDDELNIESINVKATTNGFVNISGDIYFGEGADTLKLSLEDYKSGHLNISGALDFGDDSDEDKLALSDSLNLNNEDKTENLKNILFLNMLLDKTENLDTLKLSNDDNVIVFSADKNEIVFAEANEQLSLNTEKFSKLEGGDKSDTFIIDVSDDFGEMKEINGGKGDDVFNISMSDVSKENILNGEALSLNGGDGNDMFKITSSNILTGIKIDGGAGDDVFDISMSDVSKENVLNDEALSLNGGEGNDTFKIGSSNVLTGIKIDGGTDSIKSEENDIIELGFATDENTSFKNVSNVETLKLYDNAENSLVIDETVKDFENIIGGNSGDKFTINNFENLGSLSSIDGGKGNDVFDISISNASNENVLNGEVLSLNGGEGSDTFKISSSDALGKIKIDGGEEDDTLELGFATDENMSFENISNVEALQLFEDKENTLNVGTLDDSFKTILGGNAGNTFNNVSVGKAGIIVGGKGTDIINMGEAVDNNINFENLFNNTP